MKSLSYIFLFLFSINLVDAQTETTNWIYQLENPTVERYQVKNQTKTITLKLQNIYRFRNQNFLLGLTIKKAIEEGKLTVYEDEKCTKVMSIKTAKAKMVYIFIDTVTTFNPETFEEYSKIVHTKIDRFPIDETIYELSQKWNFKAKSTSSIMALEAIHISHYELIEIENAEKKHYLFSIKGEDLESIMDASKLENQSVTWAKYIEYEGSFENDKIKQKLFTKLYLNDHKILGYYPDNEPYNKHNILTKSEIETIGASIDTIITFHPETFKEKMTVIRNFLDLNNIKTFKIAQELYFDTQDYTFKNRLLAIAPIIAVYDDNGNYKYERPMFWVVYDDDFLKWLD